MKLFYGDFYVLDCIYKWGYNTLIASSQPTCEKLTRYDLLRNVELHKDDKGYFYIKFNKTIKGSWYCFRWNNS